jgi:hypothetical protein
VTARPGSVPARAGVGRKRGHPDRMCRHCGGPSVWVQIPWHTDRHGTPSVVIACAQCGQLPGDARPDPDCLCDGCRISYLTDADRAWLESHGWSPTLSVDDIRARVMARMRRR